MTQSEIHALVEKQKEYYRAGKTLPLRARLAALSRLYATVKEYEEEILNALRCDLGKSGYEGYMCETGLALTEIRYMIKHLKRFARKKRVRTPLAQFPAKSFTLRVPYGNVLIMSPWNYPFLLTVEPLANAIAAGNTVLLKPSAYAPKTSALLAKMIAECFAPEMVATVTGGRAENAALLDEKFDLVFFTGSGGVGKEVLRRCAEHLTPAVLELGGKSPCIVTASADIPLAARRITFGKFLNCGQTCVAPDHILCDKRVKDALLQAIKNEISRQFGENPLENPDYGKIVNRKHFERLIGLIDKEKVVAGGEYDSDSLKIAPTVMDGVCYEDAVMGEEIFGPILPILTFDDFDTVIDDLKKKPKPLALYLFTHEKKQENRVLYELSFGGGCINDVIIHLATSEMGFGGVGESGMGAYHGKRGFEAFSHEKSVVNKGTRLDLPMRYQPYKSKRNERLLRFFLK